MEILFTYVRLFESFSYFNTYIFQKKIALNKFLLKKNVFTLYHITWVLLLAINKMQHLPSSRGNIIHPRFRQKCCHFCFVDRAYWVNCRFHDILFKYDRCPFSLCPWFKLKHLGCFGYCKFLYFYLISIFYLTLRKNLVIFSLLPSISFLCIWFDTGEEGLIIGLIPPVKKDFYKGSKEMNEKKIIRNVFIEGDAYFSFGDLVYIDNQYYIYFRDRVGDTFRYILFVKYCSVRYNVDWLI